MKGKGVRAILQIYLFARRVLRVYPLDHIYYTRGILESRVVYVCAKSSCEVRMRIFHHSFSLHLPRAFRGEIPDETDIIARSMTRKRFCCTHRRAQ